MLINMQKSSHGDGKVSIIKKTCLFGYLCGDSDWVVKGVIVG